MIDGKKITDNIPLELAKLAECLSGTIEMNPSQYVLTLDGSMGRGSVVYQKLEKGITVIDISIKVSKDVSIPVQLLKSETFHFLYCLKGNCIYLNENGMELHTINPFQVTLVHNRNQFKGSLLLKHGALFQMNLIQIDDKRCLEVLDSFQNIQQDTVNEFIKKLKIHPAFIHQGSYNIPIGEYLKHIYRGATEGKFDNQNLTHQLSNKGRYYLILSKHIVQFFDDMNQSQNTSGLLKKELLKIVEVSELIKSKPQIPHTIKSLSLHTGLSPAKLQDGFRFLSGKTVLEFVRHQRLKKAEELIRTSELSISEIVYSIGFTSRSYFCKIFKKRYHFSPKEYQRTNVGLKVK